MRILFIINPQAGGHTVDEFKEALSIALDQLPADQPLPEVSHLICETPNQLRASLQKRLEDDPIDIVGIVGGDGTIMEVLPVLIDFPQVRMALIPYGTGNLLATNLNVPKDFAAALTVALHGNARRIDVGRIGKHCFALLAGVGTVAEIMEHTPSRHKKLLGMWAYLVDGIKTILKTRHAWFKIRIDQRTISTVGVSVVVSNAATLMRPCPALTPEAVPDDGLLDICVIKAHSRKEYLPIVYEILTRRHVDSPTDKVCYYQGRKITIDSWPRLKVQADGNIIGKTPIAIEILPRRLNVMVPMEVPTVARPDEDNGPGEGFLELFRQYLVNS